MHWMDLQLCIYHIRVYSIFVLQRLYRLHFLDRISCNDEFYFVKLTPEVPSATSRLTWHSAGGPERQSGGAPVVFQCWGTGKQGPRKAERRPPGRWAGHTVGSRRLQAGLGVVLPAWLTGGRDRAGLQARLQQPTRRFGRHHDAGISDSPGD